MKMIITIVLFGITSFTPNTEEYKYWISYKDNVTHNKACREYGCSNGYYSFTGTGKNCLICGGAEH